MNVAVVGSGYVGLVAAACFAELGHSVICVDNDPAKLSVLKRGKTPIYEEYLPELLARHGGSRLMFSGSLRDAVEASQVVFIAVGTPPLENGEADMSYVEAVARQIAESLNGYKIVVEKSTVPVYTNRWVRRVMQLSGAADSDFDVVSNPEFLREGTAVSDFLYPDRIVVGADSERAASLLKQIYRPLSEGIYYRQPGAIPEPAEAVIPARLIVTSTKSAELIKHVSNAFLAMRISFINAVANVCEGVDGDIEQVALGVGLDRRIGRQSLKAGIGYGGSCFPKDVAAFRSIARQSGYEFPLLDEIVDVNQGQRARFLQKIRTALSTLRGKRLAVLGLAFKGGTDDIRESPAIEIARALLLEHCSLVAYDPAAMENSRQALTGDISYAKNAYEAAEGSDALVILTDWEEFHLLDLHRIKQLLRYPVVIDGRNLYSREAMQEAGLHYISVGRPAAEPEKAAGNLNHVNEAVTASVGKPMDARLPSVEDRSYALLTPAYNEERYIEETIRSVVAQQLRPKLWVIVSDGSTDRTDEIVLQYAMRHSFIRFVRREKDDSCNFACKVLALRVGFQTLAPEPTQFIGHLDADISLDPSYFRDLLSKFGEDPGLGIAGGWYFEKSRGCRWQPRPGNTTRSLPDGIQMFRRACYKDIGELPAIEYGGGEDWYAQIRARMCGWRVRSFPELKVLHLRPTGTRGSLLRRCYCDGFMDFAVGSHPLFEAAKVARMSAIPPYLLSASARMLGFVAAHILGKKRMVSPECVAFLQKEQLGRLWSFAMSVKRGHVTFDL